MSLLLLWNPFLYPFGKNCYNDITEAEACIRQGGISMKKEYLQKVIMALTVIRGLTVLSLAIAGVIHALR